LVTSSSIVDRRRLGARQHHTPVWVRQACRSWVAGGRVGRPKSSTTQTVTASGNQLLLLLLLLHLLRGRGRRGDGAWQGPVTGRASGRGRGRCSLCGSRWARRGFSISACQGPSGSLVQKGIPVLCLAWRVRRALAPVANCTPPCLGAGNMLAAAISGGACGEHLSHRSHLSCNGSQVSVMQHSHKPLERLTQC
jgi:hypothetical protein